MAFGRSIRLLAFLLAAAGLHPAPVAAQGIAKQASQPLMLDVAPHAQRDAGILFAPQTATEPYTPVSLPCSINVACSEVAAWSDASRSVVKISNGCTGVLVNNTGQDQRPYLMTAYHCGSPAVGDTLDWTFAFNYQSTTCADPAENPTPLTMTGAVVRAAQGAYSDYVLLELLAPIPAAYEVIYAGWSAEHTPPASGAVIGHPRQDLKKIALDHDPIRDLAGIFWDATFDQGTVELGSSGSPLFNEQHQLIGLTRSAITFDPNACSGPDGDDNNARILFPKFAYNWNIGLPGTRLSDFLDPAGQGTTTLPPLEPSTAWIHEVNADDQPRSSREEEEFVEIAGYAGTRLEGYTLDVYACTGGKARLVTSEALNPFVFPNDHDGIGYFVIGGSSLPGKVRDQTFSRSRHSRLSDLLPDGSGILVLKDETGTVRFDYQYDYPPRPTPPAPPHQDDDAETTRTTPPNPSDDGKGRTRTEGTTPSNNDRHRPGGNEQKPDPMPPVASNDDRGKGPQCPSGRMTRSASDAPGHNTMGFLVDTSPALDAPGMTTLLATPGEANLYSSNAVWAMLETVEVMEEAPATYSLSAAYPNPFNPRTELSLSVTRTQHVRVAVFNLLGQRVALLHDGPVEAHATYSLAFDASTLPSGLYLIRATGEYFATSQTVTLLK